MRSLLVLCCSWVTLNASCHCCSMTLTFECDSSEDWEEKKLYLKFNKR